MNLEAFARDLVNSFRERDWMDIDGGDFQDLLLKHGLCTERPATEDDCKDEWASEYGYEPGDQMIVYTDEFKAILEKP